MSLPHDQLPPEIAKQIDPEWHRNEADDWAIRDGLLSQFQGQWIGFADGHIVASGTSPAEVFHSAEDARNPFVTCVGYENAPCGMHRSAIIPSAEIALQTAGSREASLAPGRLC